MASAVLRFLRARAKLDELIAAGAAAGSIPFAEIDSLVENQLFELKEECHWLYRRQEHADKVGASSAVLFDILVGSLFHQCMKVKENSYQVEHYAPKYASLRKSLARPDTPKEAATFLKEGERIIARSRRALHQEFAYAVELFNEAAIVLRHLLIENRENPVLIRTLVENERLLDAVFGANSLEKLFREMYGGHPAAGYLKAAGDLFEGGWYDRARELCKRARKLDPRNKAGLELLKQINAAAHLHLA